MERLAANAASRFLFSDLVGRVDSAHLSRLTAMKRANLLTARLESENWLG